MNKYGLVCPIRKANPYKRMAKAIKTNHIAENILDRKFTEYGARKVLLTDITYIPYNEKHCYLSTILDAYTKQILSYELSDLLEVDFVLKTVNQLIKNHGIELSKETLIHSAQRYHYERDANPYSVRLYVPYIINIFYLKYLSNNPLNAAPCLASSLHIS